MSAAATFDAESYRLTGRLTRLSRQRPAPPRDLKYQAGRITWSAPNPADLVTHYRIYANDEFSLVREIPFGQTRLEDNLAATRVFISSYNVTLGVESEKILLGGPISLTAGAGPYTITWASTITPDLINGVVQVVTLGGDTTIAAPLFNGSATLPANVDLILILIQDGTAGRTIAFDAAYVGADGTMADIDVANVYASFQFKTMTVGATVKPVLIAVPFTGKTFA